MKDGEVKIIAVVGMSGSGKSVVVDHLAGKKVPKVYFGGMIYKEMERQGIAVTPESEREFREKIREKEGADWVVRQVIESVRKLIEAGQKRIVLDGVYSWTEYKILRKEFPGMVQFLAVVVPKRLRYLRVGRREERPLDRQEIRERDFSEIENLEKGGPIAMADWYVLNDGTKEELCEAVDGILDDVGF